MKKKLFLFTAVFCMCNQALAEMSAPSFHMEFGGSFIANHKKPKIHIEKSIDTFGPTAVTKKLHEWAEAGIDAKNLQDLSDAYATAKINAATLFATAGAAAAATDTKAKFIEALLVDLKTPASVGAKITSFTKADGTLVTAGNLTTGLTTGEVGIQNEDILILWKMHQKALFNEKNKATKDQDITITTPGSAFSATTLYDLQVKNFDATLDQAALQAAYTKAGGKNQFIAKLLSDADDTAVVSAKVQQYVDADGAAIPSSAAKLTKTNAKLEVSGSIKDDNVLELWQAVELAKWVKAAGFTNVAAAKNLNLPIAQSNIVSSVEDETITLQSNNKISHSGHLKFGGQWDNYIVEGELDFYRLNFGIANVRAFYTDNYQMMTNFAYTYPMSDRISPYLGAGLGVSRAVFKIDEKIAKQNIGSTNLANNGKVFEFEDLRGLEQHKVNYSYQLITGAQIKLMSNISLNVGYKFLSPIKKKGFEFYSKDEKNRIKDYNLKTKNHFFDLGLKFSL